MAWFANGVYRPRQSGKKIVERNMHEIIAYVVFGCLATLGANMLSDLVFSALITLSAAWQCLGFVLLHLQVRRRSDVLNISLRSLWLYALSLTCRLYSTLQYNGYLPVDRTGDWVYQLIETVELLVVLYLIHRVMREHKQSCLTGVDTCNVNVLLVGCLVLALTVHPHLNNFVVPDVLWTMALYVETVAMVPQLFLLTKLGGEVDSLLGHYIACIFASRVLIMRFWTTCYEELQPKDSAFNLPGVGVIGTQILQVVLFADFMYLYLKSHRNNTKLVLPTLHAV